MRDVERCPMYATWHTGYSTAGSTCLWSHLMDARSSLFDIASGKRWRLLVPPSPLSPNDHGHVESSKMKLTLDKMTTMITKSQLYNISFCLLFATVVDLTGLSISPTNLCADRRGLGPEPLGVSSATDTLRPGRRPSGGAPVPTIQAMLARSRGKLCGDDCC